MGPKNARVAEYEARRPAKDQESVPEVSEEVRGSGLAAALATLCGEERMSGTNLSKVMNTFDPELGRAPGVGSVEYKPAEAAVRTCDACGDELWDAVHKCGPKDWAAETNRLLRQLHEDRIKDLVRQEVAAVMSRRESA